jgi:hypothetical protein
MKVTIFFVMITFLFGCTTNIQINKTRIRSNIKFRDGFTFCKISVDSFYNSGKPKKYKIDSNFHCNTSLEFENREFEPFIKKNSKYKYRKLNEILDSLKLYDKLAYRNEDTINILGKTYIPSGIKHSKYYYEIIENINKLKFTKSNFKYKRKLYLKKENKYYSWSASNEKDKIRNRIPTFTFLKNTWYFVSLESNYGLLLSGTKTIFLYLDDEDNLKKFETNKENNGSF